MRTSHPTFRNHLFSFAAGELAAHKNLMTCVIFGRTNPVLVVSDEATLEADIICIQPDVLHRVVVREGGAEILYFDGVQLPQIKLVFKEMDSRWQNIPRDFMAQERDAIHNFRQALEGNRPDPDPKVMEIVAHLYAASFERMSQNDLSAKLGLERTQALRHFKSSTGQTFRKFKIWAAMVAAAHAAHNGEKIGLAGADAGFSDAAHTARTAMATFGLTPTMGLSGLTKMMTLK